MNYLQTSACKLHDEDVGLIQSKALWVRYKWYGAYLFAVVDHTITLSTKENTWLSCCHGTDGYVYVKLVGNSGASPWQLVTSGGQLYADENEGGE